MAMLTQCEAEHDGAQRDADYARGAELGEKLPQCRVQASDAASTSSRSETMTASAARFFGEKLPLCDLHAARSQRRTEARRAAARDLRARTRHCFLQGIRSELTEPE